VNPLLEVVMSDPMARRELLDIHEALPLWVKVVFRVRLWWCDLFHQCPSDS